MISPQEQQRRRWSIEEAERLITSLKGVVSARVVARPGGEVEEIHVLTTHEVKPKQTVRNVESALMAQLGLEVDHRTISVAQSATPPTELPVPEPHLKVVEAPSPARKRLLFCGHQTITERAHTVRHRVEIEWAGRRYSGEAKSADVARAKLEAAAAATVAAVERALIGEATDDAHIDSSGRSPVVPDVALALDGVKVVEAFDRRFVLVSIHALEGRNVSALAGVSVVEDSPDRAAILATLQATDRWVRGRV